MILRTGPGCASASNLPICSDCIAQSGRHQVSKVLCKSCGYEGESKTIVRGSLIAEVLLWLCFVLPGLMYRIWRESTRHKVCPRCNQTTVPPTGLKGIVILLVIAVVPLAYCTYRVQRHQSQVEQELGQLAGQIQSLCNVDRVCPQSMDGWERTADGRLRRGNFYYSTSDASRAFSLYYHYGPDRDIWMEGGVDTAPQRRIDNH